MAKEYIEAVQEPVQPVKSADAFPLSLDEYCMRLSASDRRVELIGGFAHSERKNGKLSDMEANFARRFVAFAGQPA